jgi:hypothetical protein
VKLDNVAISPALPLGTPLSTSLLLPFQPPCSSPTADLLGRSSSGQPIFPAFLVARSGYARLKFGRVSATLMLFNATLYLTTTTLEKEVEGFLTR